MVATMLAAALGAAGLTASVAVPGAELPAVGWFEAVKGRGSVARRWADWVAYQDVVHLHGVWEPLLVLVGRLAVATSTPYVVTPHGMLDPWSLGQKRWKKRLALAVAHRRLLNGAAAIHYLNADERRLAGPVGLIAPTVVVPNGLAVPDPLPDPCRFRATHLALVDAPYVLFLSRLHPKKGLDVLADAFSRLAARRSDVRLVVAGPEGGAGPGFAAQVRRLGLADRVLVVGPLYGADKWSALGGAAAFCLPSRQEGFSLAILEGMGAGVPVVVSEGCHFPEVAEAGAGRVVSLDPAAVADALDGVLADPQAAAKMGAAGRRLVADWYAWPAVATRLVQVYRECLRGPAGD